MTPLTCQSDTIDDFLADQLNADQQRAFEQHLDECDNCCRELQKRAASVQLWADAGEYLSTSETPVVGSEPAVGTEAHRFDFLAPTDDPQMLGRFGGHEISGVIGAGGMGIVLKGFDGALNRYAAIKVLAPHYASSGAARQRFAREAQAAAAVVHDNVIAIYGVDEFQSLPYLVMPYVKGASLQARLDRDGPLATAEMLRIAMQAARGLAAAHDQGLVHRDIKPANILLPANVERVLITDFGLARAADDASLTRSGVIAGTPQYMSPEQARGDIVDARSDLFSLGSMMYAMCTGHPPFRAETPWGILRRITDHEPRPIRDVRPEVPEWVGSIVDRLLAKHPDNRFATAAEVAQLLEDCLAHLQHPDVVRLPQSLQQFPKAGRRHNVLVRVAAAGGILLLGSWLMPHASGPKTNEATPGISPSVPPTASPIETDNVAQTFDAGGELDDIEQVLQELDAQITGDLGELSIERIDGPFERRKP